MSEKEILLAPNESRQLVFEYVARLVDTNYRRKVFLYNAYNPSATVQIVVKAKNLDTHQILLHSIFYKIYTGNNRRYVQINFDNCIYNSVNLKIFSLRNIFTEPLQLHISSVAKSEVRLFHIKYEGDVIKKPLDDALIRRYFNGLFALEGVDSNSTRSIPSLTSSSSLAEFDKSVHMEDMKWGGTLPGRLRKGGMTGASVTNGLPFVSTDDMSDLRKL